MTFPKRMAQGDGCLLLIALFLLLTSHHAGFLRGVAVLPCYCSALAVDGRPPFSSSKKFVGEFTDWLAKEHVVYQNVALVDYEHHNINGNHNNNNNDDAGGNNSNYYWYAAKHVFVLGDQEKGLAVHLLPSPLDLADTVPPALSQQLTDACSAGLLFATQTASSSQTDDIAPLLQVVSIIHIHQDVWYVKKDICQCRLLARLGKVNSRIFARKTVARRIDSPTSLEFLQEHHLWGGIKSKYNYGLFYSQQKKPLITGENDKAEKEDVLVAVATFSSRRKVTRGGVPHRSHELVRFCARRDGTVVGKKTMNF